MASSVSLRLLASAARISEVSSLFGTVATFVVFAGPLAAPSSHWLAPLAAMPPTDAALRSERCGRGGGGGATAAPGTAAASMCREWLASPFFTLCRPRSSFSRRSAILFARCSCISLVTRRSRSANARFMKATWCSVPSSSIRCSAPPSRASTSSSRMRWPSAFTSVARHSSPPGWLWAVISPFRNRRWDHVTSA